MAKKAIYIDLDDISTSKRDDGVTKIDIKEGANVYTRNKGSSSSGFKRNEGAGFRRSGTVTKTGVKNTPEEQQRAIQEQQRQQEIQQQNREKRQAQQEQRQEAARRAFLQRQQNQQQSNLRNTTSSATRDNAAVQRFKSNVQRAADRQQDRGIQIVQQKADKRERFRIGLNKEERKKPTKEVIKGRFKEVGVGFVRTGIALGEGTLTLATQFGTTVSNEKGEFEKRRVEFKGDFVTKIKQQPRTTGTILGGSLIVAPTLGAGAAGIATSVKSIGVGATASQTASQFSAVSFRPSVFGGLSSTRFKKSAFDVKAISKPSAKGTSTIVRGRGGEFNDVLLSSKQFSSKGITRSRTTLTAPETVIKGGRVSNQVREITFRQLSFSKKGIAKSGSTKIGSKEVVKGIKGGGTTTFSTKITDSILTKKGLISNIGTGKRFTTSTTGTLSKNINQNIRGFFSGRTTGTGGVKRISKLSVRGLELIGTKTKGGSVSSSGTFTLSKTNPASPASASIQSVTASPAGKSLSIIPSNIPKTADPKTEIIIPEQKQSSIQDITPVQETKQKQEPKIEAETIQDADTKQGSSFRNRGSYSTKQGSSSRNSQRNIQEQASIQEQTPKLDINSVQEQKPVQETKQKTILKTQLLQKQIPINPNMPLDIPKTKKIKTPIGPGLFIPKPQKQPKQFGSFTAQVRRGGTFFNIGRFKTPGAAFRAGREKVTGTLAATFKVQGIGKLPKAPKGFRVKQTKSGPEFIERRSFRLSKPTETKEIQLFGKAKPKKKKRNKK